MKARITCLICLLPWAVGAHADPINVALGTASSFAVLAGSTVTNTGATEIHGDIGVWPSSSLTGFSTVTQTNGVVHNDDTVAALAQSDLTTAYIAAASQPCGGTLTGQDLGGLTLNPGVYCFASSAQLNGALTLNNAGANPNAAFVFQIASALTTASNASVLFTAPNQDANVFWQIGSSATLGTGTAFAGNILAFTSITLDTGATIHCGSALARNGAVTLDANSVSIGGTGCDTSIGGGPTTPPITPVPEPGTVSLLGSGLLGLIGYGRQRLRRPAV